jgi:hypothetical protein
MKPTIIYICSDNRSGSTILDNLLAGNPKITSVGEIHHIEAYALNDRSLYDPGHPLICSCGKAFKECGFWKSVELAAGRPLETFALRYRGFAAVHGKLNANRLVRRGLTRLLSGPFLKANSNSIIRRLSGGTRLARHSYELFTAIANVAGTEFVVDSSKAMLRLMSLYCEYSQQMKIILLIRDYRAVVYSKMKRGVSLDRAIFQWCKQVRRMETAIGLLPPSSRICITYESLCEKPEIIMRDLCQFVGVEYTPSMLARNSEAIHHLGGSISKFDKSRQGIVYDESFRGAFSEGELAYMQRVAGKTAARWGYH